MPRRAVPSFVVFAAFCGLTIVMTWPLALHWRSDLPLGAGDIWQNLWNFWWWKTALLDLRQSPYSTQFLYFPFGAPLAFHTHSEINVLATLPLTAWLGPVAAYNAAILSGIALAGLGAYLLARELTGDGAAAWLAGLIFAFFPHHLEQTLEHLNLATIQFLPFVALYGLRVVRYGGWRNAVALGVCFALNALGCWHYAIFAVLFLPVVLACELAFTRAHAPRSLFAIVGGLALAGVAALVLLGPFLWPLVHSMASGERYMKLPAYRGVDLLFLVLPSDHHPLLGGLTARYYAAHRSYNRAGFLCYAGITPLVLALAAVRAIREDRRVVGWMALGLTFLVLALGAHPKVGGTPLPATFPHALFRSLPLLETLRVPNRFIVITMLALAVLAAYGAAWLTHGGRRRWLIPAAAALLLFEYLWLPFPVQHVAFPSYLTTLAHDPQAGAVLDIPFCTRAKCAWNQAVQTVHERPIAGGYISVSPARAEAALMNDPVLGRLIGFDPDVPDHLDVAHLRALGFGTVILHKDRTREFAAARLADLGPSTSYYQQRQFSLSPGIARATLERISSEFEAAGSIVIHDDAQIRVVRLP